MQAQLPTTVLAVVFLAAAPLAQAPAPLPPGPVSWPGGGRAALSLSFDDARPSQLTEGVPLFKARQVRVTFYVVPDRMGDRADAWRAAARAGHEIASHSLAHPCSGNFPWSRPRALEDYTIERMRAELREANARIEQQIGTRGRTFAYPCGQTYVGRGTGTTSYVPLVAEMFLAGRGWLGETANDPAFVDLAQVLAIPMDDVSFDRLRPQLEQAVEAGSWIVLAGHDIGPDSARQTTRLDFLRDLLAWAQAPDRRIWIDTVEAVATHIQGVRDASRRR